LASIFTAPTIGTTWLVRTHFGDQAGWDALAAAAATDPLRETDPSPEDVFELVEDPEFEGLTAGGLIGLEPNPYDTYLLVDHLAMTHPEHPVLAVDANDEPGRSFRLIPGEVSAFAANMLLGNMDFSDFADAVGDDGIFRTFGPDRNTPVLPPEPRSAPVDAHPVADGTPVDGRSPVQDDSTVAPTIRLAFGQQWPPDQELLWS
jgi:hypothetical protein